MILYILNMYDFYLSIILKNEKKREANKLVSLLSAMWEYSEKLAVCNLQQGSNQNLTIPVT